MDNKEVIKEFKGYVGCFVECCESDKYTHQLLESVLDVIEDQAERIAIMSEGDTEAMLNKACETVANFDLDFVCDDNTLDDGWCNKHCKTAGQKPECFRHWLMKQTTKTAERG